MILTMSRFYYGHEITKDNLFISFNEGSGEISAQMRVGDYTLNEFVREIERTMNENGTLTYSVLVDRYTRIITISATGNFDLLVITGSQSAFSVFTLAGFVTDKIGSNSYSSDASSGSEYSPQFLLQSFVSFDDNQRASEASVNVSASGIVEVLSFGNEQFMDCNFEYITNYNMGENSPIETNASGVEAARNFMLYCIRKNKIEFIPDRLNPNIFVNCLLESTESNSKGTGFKLKEMYSKGLAGFFETGKLVFRKVE